MRTVRTIGFGVILSGAAGLAVLCFVIPAIVGLVEAFRVEQWAQAGLGPRRLRLLLRGVVIAAGAAMVAQVMGGGLAAGLCAARASRLRGLTAWVCLVVLLTPPYIYTYAWNLVLLPGGVMVGAEGAVKWPAWLLHEGRAVLCLGAWTAPVAAAVLACGWRSSGRQAYRLTLLDASPVWALLRGGLPALRPWIAVALLAAGLLAITEHSVCDLCQAPTWNTEILGLIQNPDMPGLLLAWPLVALVGLLLLALWPLRASLRRLLSELGDWGAADEALGSGGRSHGRWGLLGLGLVAVIVLLLPWGILLAELRDIRALGSVWVHVPREWPDGLRCAAGSALAGAWLAIGVDSLLEMRRSRPARALGAAAYAMLGAALIAAVVPPALVGDAFAAAYVRWDWLSRHWPIVSLVTTARFAIIPMLALRIAGRSVDAELTAMAATDGAGWATTYLHVRLPLCLPALVTGAMIVGLLSLTEVAATHLVRPAGLESVALTLLNQIHYGRNDEIVAMSLYLAAFVGVVVAVGLWVTVAWRRWPRARR
jgi:ABC-type Fe3+ transport system permease subunit